MKRCQEKSEIRYAREIPRPVAVNREMHEALRQARKEHRDPVDRRLEQDRLDQRGPIEELEEGHRVGGDHGLADDERRHGGEHEIADGDGIVGDEEVRRQNDEVETDEEEDCRRQRSAQLVQNPGADAPRKRGNRARPSCRCFLCAGRGLLAGEDRSSWAWPRVPTGYRLQDEFSTNGTDLPSIMLTSSASGSRPSTQPRLTR